MVELVRKPWQIENRLHWRRAFTLGEDTCQTRTGAVKSLLARPGSTVLSGSSGRSQCGPTSSLRAMRSLSKPSS